MRARLPPLAGVEAILAVHRAVTAGDEWNAGIAATFSTGGSMHGAHIATIAVAVAVAGLSVFSNEERIERIRSHVEVYQISVASLSVTLPARCAQKWSRKPMKLPELALGGGVVKFGITLLADYCGCHALSRRHYLSLPQLYVSNAPQCLFL